MSGSGGWNAIVRKKEQLLRNAAVLLRTWLFTLPLIGLATVAMASASLLVSLFDHTGNPMHKLARIWSEILLKIAFVRVETEGMEKLDPASSYVLVANHSSYYDTPAIMARIPLQFRFFAKQGLFQIPFLGTHLKRAGHFPVMFDDPRASLKSMLDGARQIKAKGLSVLVFPEGGRSLVSLEEFKEGAAHMAIKAGVPMVPIGVVGARKILPMHGKGIRSGTIRLKIGDPIPTAEMGSRDRAELTRRAMEQVSAMIGEPIPGRRSDL